MQLYDNFSSAESRIPEMKFDVSAEENEEYVNQHSQGHDAQAATSAQSNGFNTEHNMTAQWLTHNKKWREVTQDASAVDATAALELATSRPKQPEIKAARVDNDEIPTLIKQELDGIPSLIEQKIDEIPPVIEPPSEISARACKEIPHFSSLHHESLPVRQALGIAVGIAKTNDMLTDKSGSFAKVYSTNDVPTHDSGTVEHVPKVHSANDVATAYSLD